MALHVATQWVSAQSGETSHLKDSVARTEDYKGGEGASAQTGRGPHTWRYPSFPADPDGDKHSRGSRSYWGAREPRLSIPPRHTRKAWGSWND